MTSPEVRTLMARVLELDPSTIHGALGYGDVPEWDSQHHVELVLALEERLDVEITPEQMVELTPVSAIEEFVERHAASVSRGTGE